MTSTVDPLTAYIAGVVREAVREVVGEIVGGPLVYTDTEAAGQLGIDRRTLHTHFLANGVLPIVKMGSRTGIPRQALEQWVRENQRRLGCPDDVPTAKVQSIGVRKKNAGRRPRKMVQANG